MLRVHAAEGLRELALDLAEILADPLSDPMASELIAVPTVGMQRWLSLELSRHLGASRPGAGDGVSANIEMVFPAEFMARILHGASGSDPAGSPAADGTAAMAALADDPWRLERVAWILLEELHGSRVEQADDETPPPEHLGHRLELAPGATEWARARRLADLFDTYMTHRPEMIRRWRSGDDCNGVGDPIDEAAAWQPELWRRVRQRIGVPSPPEAAIASMEQLRSGQHQGDLPERVCLFGLTTVPGGAPMLELLDALATQREVHLLLSQPSLGLARDVAESAPAVDSTGLPRSLDRSAELVHHPLLRSWGRSSRETMVLVGNRLADSPGGHTEPDPTGAPRPATVLGALQADLLADRAPSADLVPTAEDTSVVIHSCHGETRQVEVLRDQILHLLADDPTLAEDDIAVICPALDRFAPLIESVFGRPDGVGSPPPEPTHPDDPPAGDARDSSVPRLRYRLADRSLGGSYELLAALGSLVELMASRFSERAVVDFASLPVVRRSFGFDENDLGLIADWVEATNVRWGLDGSHRARSGVPAEHTSGTWSRALDRLLIGVTTSEDPALLAEGELLAVPVEGSGVSLAGRFAQLLRVLESLHHATQEDHTIELWVELLAAAARELFQVERDRHWELQRLESLLATIVADADGSQVPLSLADLRHLIGGHLGAPTGRPGFFRGGITVSSPTPLRGIPHRVVCILGMDQSAFGISGVDGDDLIGADPHTGDRDRRTDTRQTLLDTLLGVREHLVILRNGADVITNQRIFPAVVLAELIDAIGATVHPEHRQRFLEGLTITHPRQRFDELNFTPGPPTAATSEGRHPTGATAGSARPWSFDPVACAGASARRTRSTRPAFIEERLAHDDPRVRSAEGSTRRIQLGTLKRFLDHPPRFFLQRVLEMQLSETPERDQTERLFAPVGSSGIPPAPAGRDLPVELSPLERWAVWNRLLQHRLDGRDSNSFSVVEQARDGLPPGALGHEYLESGELVVEALLRARDATGVGSAEPREVPVEVVLRDGTVVFGSVRDDCGHTPGPVSTSMSKLKDKYRLQAWLDLLALTATEPDEPWRSVLLNRKDAKGAITALELQMTGDEGASRRLAAVTALESAVELLRMGLREPLPLFPNLSGELYRGRGSAKSWSGDAFPGDGEDTWIRTAFDHATYEQITAMEILPHDPPGDARDRAGRYAEHLWSLYDRTAPDRPLEIP